MIYLLLSILSSATIFVVFKLFDRFKIRIFQAIVINYFVAFASGWLAYEGSLAIGDIAGRPWFLYTIALGGFFILIFNLMALTTQRSGLTVVSVATKMSLAVPILFGLIYYKESLGFGKALGIVLALLSVYLVSVRRQSGFRLSRGELFFPAMVFLGSGIIDTSLKFLEDRYVGEQEVPIFSATIFGAAACIGLLGFVYERIRGSFKFEWKNVLAGICLGVPNYFSVFFLVKALKSGLLESSGIFTVNNVAIVVLSTLLGIFLFSEKLSARNWLGVALAVSGIVLVASGSIL